MLKSGNHEYNRNDTNTHRLLREVVQQLDSYLNESLAQARGNGYRLQLRLNICTQFLCLFSVQKGNFVEVSQ